MYMFVKNFSLVKLTLISGLMTLLVTAGPEADEENTSEYSYATEGTLCFGDQCVIKILLEAANFGGDEIEMAEITFSGGHEGRGHPHGSIEIFYVVSGMFGHEVNGVENILSPGMVGVVKPGDTVRHSVPGAEDAKVLVIWVPGGEIDRIFDRSNGTAIE